MSKVLKINLDSQKGIKQEGEKNNLSKKSDNSLTVGKIKTNFFLPELKIDSLNGTDEEISQPLKKVVTRINKFIANIADDYFLLGLYLISLHSLLKESKLSTEQIKSWYAENINMPYSSAMQCRKVAQVYSENPELIERYTASGAYLLSSCETAEEREEIWQKAKGEKATATIRDIREELKLTRANKLLLNSEKDHINNENKQLDSDALIPSTTIRKSLDTIIMNTEDFIVSEKTKDKERTKKILLDSVKRFLSYLEKNL